MKYAVHKTVNPYLKLVRSHTEPYTTKVLDTEILVHPNVMSPEYDWSPRFHAQNMPNQKGKDFLEVGCGSGVLSVFAALQGAKSIVAVDINPNAIENTKVNFKKHNIPNATVFYSDVFTNVKGKFDTINFAAPYHGNTPKDILEYGVSDPEYRTLKIFLANVKNYLKEGGQIVLGFSDTGDTDLLHTLFIENSLYMKELRKEQNDGWTALLYILEPIQFKNSKQKYIYNSDYSWFKKYKDQIISGKILKVGYGLGFASYFINLFNNEMHSLDIVRNPDSLNENIVVIYDGVKIPYPDNAFDTVICTYTLHHSEDPHALFMELSRVSKSKIIVVEETYKNFFQKVQIVFFCWLTNMGARQKVTIQWDSYLSSKRLFELFKEAKLNTTQREKIARRSYSAELIVGEK